MQAETSSTPVTSQKPPAETSLQPVSPAPVEVEVELSTSVGKRKADAEDADVAGQSKALNSTGRDKKSQPATKSTTTPEKGKNTQESSSSPTPVSSSSTTPPPAKRTRRGQAAQSSPPKRARTRSQGVADTQVWGNVIGCVLVIMLCPSSQSMQAVHFCIKILLEPIMLLCKLADLWVTLSRECGFCSFKIRKVKCK